MKPLRSRKGGSPPSLRSWIQAFRLSAPRPLFTSPAQPFPSAVTELVPSWPGSACDTNNHDTRSGEVDSSFETGPALVPSDSYSELLEQDLALSVGNIGLSQCPVVWRKGRLLGGEISPNGCVWSTSDSLVSLFEVFGEYRKTRCLSLLGDRLRCHMRCNP